MLARGAYSKTRARRLLCVLAKGALLGSWTMVRTSMMALSTTAGMEMMLVISAGSAMERRIPLVTGTKIEYLGLNARAFGCVITSRRFGIIVLGIAAAGSSTATRLYLLVLVSASTP
jgi:hypothetical protein